MKGLKDYILHQILRPLGLRSTFTVIMLNTLLFAVYWWHFQDNTAFTQQQSFLMGQRRSNTDLDRKRRLWKKCGRERAWSGETKAGGGVFIFTGEVALQERRPKLRVFTDEIKLGPKEGGLNRRERRGLWFFPLNLVCVILWDTQHSLL